MIKKPSELSEAEKTILHWLILALIIISILILSVKAFVIYQEQGFGTCVEFTDGSKECFSNLEEAEEYVKAKNYPNNLDYNYINKNNNLSYYNEN